MQNNLADDSFRKEIVEINENLNELKNDQKYLILLEEKNNKTLMRKIGKLQEYNEINDMTNQVFEKRISNIENTLNEIMKRMSA